MKREPRRKTTEKNLSENGQGQLEYKPLSFAKKPYSQDYTRWENPTTLQGLRVTKALQDWLIQQYDVAYMPVVSICIACDGIAIMVGDIPVWDSHNYILEDLTLDLCKERYKEQIMNLVSPFE